MSPSGRLKSYNNKRNFKRSPEPQGKLSSSSQPMLSFVVQEHVARHHHFDFRLEWKGVLKSWAVPKDIVMDASIKRLAIEVEDHPLKYAQFEGTIPRGEYGAGAVTIWDKGEWVPLKSQTKADTDRSFKKGHLQFFLKGEKLNGIFQLVRIDNNKKQPQWLLSYSKHQSVKAKNGRAEDPPQLLSRQAYTSSLLKDLPQLKTGNFISPMLCELHEQIPAQGDWFVEKKYDGYRIQIHLQQKKILAFSRSGRLWSSHLQPLLREILKLGQNVILDGELVLEDDQGRANFQGLNEKMANEEFDPQMKLYIFDILALNGKDLREVALVSRRALLEEMWRNSALKRVELSALIEPAEAKLRMSDLCQNEEEGLVFKEKASGYETGRTSQWRKVKCQLADEFLVVGFSLQSEGDDRLGALRLAQFKKAKWREVGNVGTGWSASQAQNILHTLKKMSPHRAPGPKGKPYYKVHPQLVAEVGFQQKTAAGNLRNPVFKGLRQDKSAEDLMPKKMSVPVEEGKTIEEIISHPSKILSAQKETKLDLAHYYEVVSFLAFPFWMNKPIVFVSAPNGIFGQRIFIKHPVSPMPDTLSNKNNLYLEGPNGLLSLAQKNAVEIHLCNEPHLGAQVDMVFDLDAGEGIKFSQLVTLSLDIRDKLRTLDLKSYLKLSGQKGLHIHVPLDSKIDPAQIHQFSLAFAKVLENENPQHITTKSGPKNRVGKIFIDHLRNKPGGLIVAPYSPRLSKERGFTVALPIEWSEVGDWPADHFNFARAFQHILNRRSDPWKNYYSLSQRLPDFE